MPSQTYLGLEDGYCNVSQLLAGAPWCIAWKPALFDIVRGEFVGSPVGAVLVDLHNVGSPIIEIEVALSAVRGIFSATRGERQGFAGFDGSIVNGFGGRLLGCVRVLVQSTPEKVEVLERELAIAPVHQLNLHPLTVPHDAVIQVLDGEFEGIRRFGLNKRG